MGFRMPTSLRLPIVNDQRFILATRETGYRSTASAIAELVDNSIQATAKSVRIFIDQDGVGVERQLRVAVLDDGTGMDKATLRQALQFGGSTRFDDRSGPGRFGMGLPNSSVSQSKRLEVYSWKDSKRPLYAYFDVDEISAGRMRTVPDPARKKLPAWVAKYIKRKSGTLVIWDRCDRLDNRKAATIAAKLHGPLGRVFRYYLWNGVRIWINGEPVKPIDPLYLQGSNGDSAVAYGDPMTYEIRVPKDPTRISKVTVRFSELPVAKWHNLTVEEKRYRMVSSGAGVSVVRASREVAYGWHFMGGKRKENYDDWWRCEVSFEPDLDECFGVTHSKQDINPVEDLRAILCPDLEAIAHTLNSRARSAYAQVRALSENGSHSATVVASAHDRLLSPLNAGPAPKSKSDGQRSLVLEEVRGKLKSVDPKIPAIRYRIDAADLRCPDFYTWCESSDKTIILTLNRKHPFYEQVYLKACESEDLRFGMESLLLACVRADRMSKTESQSRSVEEHRAAWSNALSAFLEGRNGR